MGKRNGELIKKEDIKNDLIIHQKSDVVALVSGKVSASGDFYISPAYGGYTAYAAIYERGHKPSISEIQGEPKLYIWLGTFKNYSSVEVSVVAHSLEEARKLAAKELYAKNLGCLVEGLLADPYIHAVGEALVTMGDPDEEDESLETEILDYIKSYNGYVTTDEVCARFGISEEKWLERTKEALKSLLMSGKIIQNKVNKSTGVKYWSVVE